jgi:hypothetical protein
MVARSPFRLKGQPDASAPIVCHAHTAFSVPTAMACEYFTWFSTCLPLCSTALRLPFPLLSQAKRPPLRMVRPLDAFVVPLRSVEAHFDSIRDDLWFLPNPLAFLIPPRDRCPPFPTPPSQSQLGFVCDRFSHCITAAARRIYVSTQEIF